MKREVKIRVGEHDLTIETGYVAKQANGAVIVRYADTLVLVSTVMSREPKEDVEFLPLSVEYQERTYAAGKIPGGFFRREGRPTEKEILTARLTDRPIRPLFPQGLRNEVQIISVVLSSDGEHDPDILSVIGASAALYISDIPFIQPVAAVKIAYLDDKFILNPTYKQIEDSKLNLIIAGTEKGIVMLEGEAKEASEEIFRQAIDFGYKAIFSLINLQQELRNEVGKEKREIRFYQIPSEIYNTIKQTALSKIKEINLIPKKEERIEAMNFLAKEFEEKLKDACSPQDVKEALYRIQKEEVRRYTLKENIRVDGRKFDELRAISCEVGILPRTHGSALFTRGQTQSLAVTTLGTPADEQMVEALEGELFKKFMVHYNFPPFSVGEIKPMRGPGRREIGHGALAEKALKPVMPKEEDFPYTVRVVSDILESNGSSSMATVCASSLSLMDAGVSIKTSVAGVALGLIKELDKEIILTDIAGLEDHYGDMDFKVAGTKNGITAVQLDLKIDGISLELISKVLEQSKHARFKILETMDSVLSKPRAQISSYAPRIISFQLEPEKIGLLIGTGGKTIRKIISDTGAKFDIEEDGVVHISADNEEQLQSALERVRQLTQDVEVGQIYSGKVTRITNFGAFCEIFPGKEGLIHISEISNRFVAKVEDHLKVGDEVKVKVIGVDDFGKVQLSLKRAGESFSEIEPEEDSKKDSAKSKPNKRRLRQDK